MSEMDAIMNFSAMQDTLVTNNDLPYVSKRNESIKKIYHFHQEFCMLDMMKKADLLVEHVFN